jgi:hypothetical protein
MKRATQQPATCQRAMCNVQHEARHTVVITVEKETVISDKLHFPAVSFGTICYLLGMDYFFAVHSRKEYAIS